MPFLKKISTPLGKTYLGANDQGICLFDFEQRKNLDRIMQRIERLSGESFVAGEHPYFKLLEEQIEAYFAGERQIFDLPLQFLGTPFQKKVWQGLCSIPYGETRTYKEQAQFLGNEKAMRAVANANGQNGIAIIIPCHRVIGSNGKLTGYGGGLDFKKRLLEHEQKYAQYIKI